jgi:hypothetical protein
MNALMFLASLLVDAADKVPAPEDVKAGWLGFGVFIALGIAVALLGFSLTRHLRKASDNAERGVFGPTETTSDKPHPSAS